MPRVLIADSLSPAAVDIFKQRGIDTDIKTGLSKDELIAIIGDYDGLVVRSDTKPNKDVIAAAKTGKEQKVVIGAMCDGAEQRSAGADAACRSGPTK